MPDGRDDFDVTDDTSAEELESRARRVRSADAAVAVARLDERLKNQDKTLARLEKGQEKIQGSIDTLTNHVNHEMELMADRLLSLESTREETQKAEKRQYETTIRHEVTLDAQKVAIMGFVGTLVLAFIYIGSAVVQHILFG